MNSNKLIFNIDLIAISLQKMFYLETDMIMRFNVVLCSYAVFSSYQYVYIILYYIFDTPIQINL